MSPAVSASLHVLFCHPNTGKEEHLNRCQAPCVHPLRGSLTLTPCQGPRHPSQTLGF